MNPVVDMNPEIWALIENEEVGSLVEALVIAEGLRLRRFDNVSEPLGLEEPPGGFILAVDSTGRYSGYATIIKRFQKNFLNFEVLVFAEGDEEDSQSGLQEGIVDAYVEMPADRDDFMVRGAHLVALRRVKSSAGIIGRSAALREILDMVIQVAPTEVSVLIEGESGSGKELIARAIHLRSNRRSMGFEAVNCGAMAEGVLESELFGHEKGSFTGAVARRAGLFERADKGTLFLDEVGEMSLTMQVRLLRVLEKGEFMRVGGVDKLTTDVRVIAATNRELETDVERGQFRKDLYYRLKVVQVRIPPLRARQGDIPVLASHFLRSSCIKHGKAIRGIDREGMNLLKAYPWPGNIRELANMMDNLVVMNLDGNIRAVDIERRLQEKAPPMSFPDLPVHVQKTRDQIERELIINSLFSLHSDVREILRLLRNEGIPGGEKWRRWVEVEEADKEKGPALDDLEREAIMEALRLNNGNRRKAARQLGLSERTLYRRLKGYGVK